MNWRRTCAVVAVAAVLTASIGCACETGCRTACYTPAAAPAPCCNDPVAPAAPAAVQSYSPVGTYPGH